jgi:hypothetical protein
MQCRAKKQDGSRCRARALAGHKRCPLHAEPGRAAELGRKGGRGRAICEHEVLKSFAPPTSARDVADLLAQSIIEVREGKADPKLANSISYLGTALLRALEVADLEKRVQALEAGSDHGES